RWYPQELTYLAGLGIVLETPLQQNQRLVYQRQRPVLWTQKRLILCLPDYVNGQAVSPHPLYGDLMAAFAEDLAPISLHIDHQEIAKAWSTNFDLPKLQLEAAQPLAAPTAFLQLERPLAEREMETPTSLDKLLYYPHQWVFRYHAELRAANILSLVHDFRLYGNLAHRLLEELLRQPYQGWTRMETEEWVNAATPTLLRKEGAILLMYGREPDRIAFVKHMKYAAWSLVNLLRDNNWEVVATEHELEGQVGQLHLKGRADLVLARGEERAIVDLKWSGLNRYTSTLTSREDVQLALYAQLLEGANDWAHTAYYIINRGRMLVRNKEAFADAHTIAQETDHREVYDELLKAIISTYNWRVTQLQNGQVELRCAATAVDLEDAYEDKLMELLEMKQADARYNDYEVLMGLVR
ncbi:MAG: PD-(D/E)XK nuclease family protein, partial [Bacteroidota bacterium]